MKVYAITDIGRMRPINEDSYYAPLEGERFCAVADGMGGHNAGEVASAMAVQVFSEQMRKADHITAETLHSAVERANEAVYRQALENEGMSGMGTTFSALAEEGDTAYLAHVGDSRIYLVRRGAIMQVTTDHTLVEEMVRKGMLTPREARVHPRRNIITRALGTDETGNGDILDMEKEAGDLYLICSDGLSEYVEEDQMRAVLLSQPLEQAADTLLNLALEGGGRDNISLVLAEVEA